MAKKKKSQPYAEVAVLACAVAVVVALLVPHSAETDGAKMSMAERKEYDRLNRLQPSGGNPFVGFIPDAPEVETVDWKQVQPTLPPGTTLSDYLKGRGVALKLINAGPQLWQATQEWSPATVLQKLGKMAKEANMGGVAMMESNKPENMYFGVPDDESLAPLHLKVRSRSADKAFFILWAYTEYVCTRSGAGQLRAGLLARQDNLQGVQEGTGW